MPVTFKDEDKGYIRIQRDIRALRDRSVKVGIMGSETVKGVSVVDYAMYNEFGTRNIPARPFMATTYAQYGDQMSQFIDYLASRMFVGLISADRVLRVIGESYQAKVQMTIRNAKEWAVPNAPGTIAQKGSSSPLIDTGRMIQSVRYEIE